MNILRYIFGFIFASVAVISLIRIDFTFSSAEVNSFINLPIEKHFKNGEISIKELKLEGSGSDIKANFTLDLNHKIKLEDFKGSAVANIYTKGDSIYLKVIDLSIEEKEELAAAPDPYAEQPSFFNKMKKMVKKTTTKILNSNSSLISDSLNIVFDNKAIFSDFKVSFVEDLYFEELPGKDFQVTGTTYLGWFIFICSFFLAFLTLSREIGILFMTIYQKFVSPHKGYRCAKGAVHGGDSCSASVKKVFKEKGAVAGMSEYFRSTSECKDAYNTYTSGKSKSSGGGSALKCCDDIGDCSPDIGHC